MDKFKDKYIHVGLFFSIAAFIVAFAFFQFAYPYHLIRREQMNLFLFDWDYLNQTYHGIGWLVRIISDFLEQFFHLQVVGPFVIAALLSTIGFVTYRICLKFCSRSSALVTASLFFLWSFFRETGNLYMTRYTLSVLGYLSLILIILHFIKYKFWPLTAFLSFPLGIWLLGAPVQKDYGKFLSIPKFEYERVIGLDAEVVRENWEKVIELSNRDLHMIESSFCYNLAQAMKGNLGNKLFCHSQSGTATLLIRIAPNQTAFRNCLAGEAWFHLGELTIAEQSAIIALQASPKHTGTRYIQRLAKVNLISGEYGAAQKYLGILSKTLFYRKWALSMMPENQDLKTSAHYSELRSKLISTDFVHHSYENRTILLSILESDPYNRLAHNYLLCHDLLDYDLELFMEDYSNVLINASIYQEAVLIWLSQHNRLNEKEASRYGVKNSTVDRMNRFFRMPESYRNTYWYYYMNALED